MRTHGSTVRMRQHRQREAKKLAPDKARELISELFANTEVYQTATSVEIEWNFTPSQWQAIHMLAQLQGVDADKWLEAMGRKFINSRGAALQVSKGKAVLDVDDLEIGG